MPLLICKSEFSAECCLSFSADIDLNRVVSFLVSAKKNTYPVNENKVQSSRMKSSDYPNKKYLRTLETKQIHHLLYNDNGNHLLYTFVVIKYNLPE